MARIFVSYRRQDSPYVAAVLKDRFERQFGEHSVFLDIDNIPIGADFREHIDLAVQQCDVMLVLIGDAWLRVMTGKERNRLFEPRDFVRAEIEAALRRAIPIVPVLVEDAEMPGAEDLPESIQDLTYRNSAELRAGRDFNNHLSRLVEGLGQMLKPPTKASVTDAQPRIANSPPRVSAPATPLTQVVPEKHTIDGPRKEYQQARKGQGTSTSETANSGTSFPSRTRIHTLEDVERLPVQLAREESATTPAAPALNSKPESQGTLPQTGFRETIDRSFANVSEVFKAPHIPENKLQNAVKTYAAKVGEHEVVLLYDNTVWGSGKTGFLLTEGGVFWRNGGSYPQSVGYKDVMSSELLNDSATPVLQLNGKYVHVGTLKVAKALETFLKAMAGQNGK